MILTTDGTYSAVTVDQPEWVSWVEPAVEMVTIEIEVSQDLEHWQWFMTATLPRGMSLQVIEPGEQRKFYKIKTR